ncbi:2-succinyl-5-enolpyruvyl-6-hydroxy-3-cyclohexene-1-carboxylic-acid synthase [Sediminibacillus albus]|uniref:2-succinyl-5-enolpyruvyl-6-hydroxy-3-cyclohexene-1-carboxylate synthase n=1 Tax=Sediminibacillus albus TaxID=407036 RepID=A0A1G8Z0K8_9BACI|nr:2-succinyl-5-enolpyruvyl-6-hydroxy-3-cyclohexene-1-carboxylic-acid synthase [Sediminibacillus albus]SDK08618.1 2-succinyl-5-enolpyruvyl-6-hydroxy-3-cyclohexene-1-carboxylate synthase [Sediminibacillus albus]
MTHEETLTRYTANFIDELHRNGLTDVVISPGSRSTPLALTFAEHAFINHWVNMDERSAAFFALGMAKQQNKPVAVVCTSGTAAANYFPAIVEAYYSRVPLVVLTADRPHELRDVGAPQAIEQINMYGQYVKWFHEMALPESTPPMLQYARSKAARAVQTACFGNAGPVHLNFPFREPLLPDFSLENLWEKQEYPSFHQVLEGKDVLEPSQLEWIINKLSSHEKGLIVVGPQFDTELAEAVSALANQWNIPVLADPLSQLRAGQHDKANIIEGYDAILKSKQIRDRLNPDFIIRFGAMPVSKPYLLFIKEHSEIEHFIVEAHHGYREPAGTPAQFIFADPVKLCSDFCEAAGHLAFNEEWLQSWRLMNQTAKRQLLAEQESTFLTEGHTVKQLAEAATEESTIYVGNSMPIRDMDTFFMTTPKQIRILGNRGANGIDGMTSSALGAAAHGEKVALLLGDLSFFHDFNGLMLAKQYNMNLTVVLINNNGGGIFSFLPQAGQSDHFETIFGTPMDIDFQHIIAMYQGRYSKPESWEELRQALTDSYQEDGLSVIEVQTEREENASWHKAKWTIIEQKLMEYFEG